MKHYKELSQIKLSDIEMYSMPATDENMQNVANLFERATASAARRDRPRVRPLRALLAAAMAVVMMFSVAIVAYAIVEAFTATSTEQISDGLERDGFVLFDEAIAENQGVSVLAGGIYKFCMDTTTINAYYEYKDGKVQQTESPLVGVVLGDENYEEYFAGLGDGMIIRPENGTIIVGEEFSTEFTDPNTGKSIIINRFVSYGRYFPGSKWLAFNAYQRTDNSMFIYNTETEEIFDIGPDLLDGEEVWSYGWLAEDVLAVIAGGEQQFYDEPPVKNRGRHLYVFRIDESFLS